MKIKDLRNALELAITQWEKEQKILIPKGLYLSTEDQEDLK